MKLKTNKIGFKIISFQNNFKGDTTQQSIGTVISSEVKAINKEEIQFSKEISNKIYGIRNADHKGDKLPDQTATQLPTPTLSYSSIAIKWDEKIEDKDILMR